MSRSLSTAVAVLLVISPLTTVVQAGKRSDGADIWCGKAYSPQWPAIDPGGWFAFAAPVTGGKKLHLQCRPRHNVYYAADPSNNAEAWQIDVATDWVDYDYPSLAEAPLCADTQWQQYTKVKITVDISTAHVTAVGSDSAKTVELPLQSSSSVSFVVKPSADDSPQSLGERKISCTAQLFIGDTADAQLARREVSLYYLPTPPPTVPLSRLDFRWQTSSVVNTRAERPAWQNFFSTGFYDPGDYLGKYLKRATDGFHQNTHNIIPGAGEGNMADDWGKGFYEQVVERMMAAKATPGIEETDSTEMSIGDSWFIPSARHSYQLPDKLAGLMNDLLTQSKGLAPVLTWYTADEPDGWDVELTDASLAAERLHNEIDPRLKRPVSLVLNCRDHFFDEYSKSSNIITVDAYPVGVDVSFSKLYKTVCNATHGDCGCDNCLGTMVDTYTRVRETRAKIRLLERDGSQVVWSVGQGFPTQHLWDRTPSYREVIAQSTLGVLAGARGLAYWMLPTVPWISTATTAVSDVIRPNKHFFDGALEAQHLTFHPQRARDLDAADDMDADWQRNEREGRLRYVRSTFLHSGRQELLIALHRLQDRPPSAAEAYAKYAPFGDTYPGSDGRITIQVPIFPGRKAALATLLDTTGHDDATDQDMIEITVPGDSPETTPTDSPTATATPSAPAAAATPSGAAGAAGAAGGVKKPVKCACTLSPPLPAPGPAASTASGSAAGAAGAAAAGPALRRQTLECVDIRKGDSIWLKLSYAPAPKDEAEGGSGMSAVGQKIKADVRQFYSVQDAGAASGYQYYCGATADIATADDKGAGGSKLGKRAMIDQSDATELHDKPRAGGS